MTSPDRVHGWRNWYDGRTGVLTSEAPSIVVTPIVSD
jgi:hypothetical protein